MSSDIYSLFISTDPLYFAEIKKALGPSEHAIHHLEESSALDEALNSISGQLSCILIDIKLCDELDLERFIRKNKSRDDLKYIPVVGLIQSGYKEHMPNRSLFFHLLEEPIPMRAIKNTIESAQTDFKRFMAIMAEVNSRNSAIGLINSGTFRLQTMEQAEALTTMLSLACPEPAVVALGLSELLVNAIEHGNLAISYEEKTRLMEKGQWGPEVQKRLSDEKYNNRYVEIIFSRTPDIIQFTVKDQGNGFDWRPFVKGEMAPVDSKHGRGIALALAMGFHEMSYNDKGNQVTATIHLS